MKLLIVEDERKAAVARMHGGSAEVRSADGVTTVEFRLRA